MEGIIRLPVPTKQPAYGVRKPYVVFFTGTNGTEPGRMEALLTDIEVKTLRQRGFFSLVGRLFEITAIEPK